MALSNRINCPQCGASAPSRALKCPSCGAQLRMGFGRKGLVGEPAKPGAQTRAPKLISTDFVSAARVNTRNTVLLISVILLLLYGVGYMFGWFGEVMQLYYQTGGVDYPIWFFSEFGFKGGFISLAAGGAGAAFALTNANTLVMQQCGGRYLMPFEAPQVHNIVEEMALASGLPKPKVVLIETDVPNAFAFGMSPKEAVVGVTQGLVNLLDREELQGVIGHEMGHVANLDIRYATAVGVLVGAIAMAAETTGRLMSHGRYRGSSSSSSDSGGSAWGVIIVLALLLLFIYLAPLAAELVRMAVSRQREYLADATSARFTRNPAGLIRALEKLAAAQRPFEGAGKSTQHMFIINPFRNFGDKASALMSTHPPLERRIERLRNLSGFKV